MQGDTSETGKYTICRPNVYASLYLFRTGQNVLENGKQNKPVTISSIVSIVDLITESSGGLYVKSVICFYRTPSYVWLDASTCTS